MEWDDSSESNKEELLYSDVSPEELGAKNSTTRAKKD
jgi:hypothetical protein